MPELTIIIPACNEELSLGQTVDRLEQSVKLDYEIVIVNDHLQIGLKKRALILAERYKNIRVVDNSGPGVLSTRFCAVYEIAILLILFR